MIESRDFADRPLRVFVSGTQVDLQEERSTVKRVIEELGCEALLAESSGSMASSAEEVCIDLAKSCDLFIGLYGLRYGSIPPKMTVSVTELEFETARGVDPTKILVYRKEGEADARQKQFLRRVGDFRDGYFHSQPFTSLEMIASYVRKDVPKWIASRVRHGLGSVPRPKGTIIQEPVKRRRPVTEEDLTSLRGAVDSQDSEARIHALKDLVALGYDAQVETSQEVRSWLWRFLRGSTATRTETLRTIRVLLGQIERGSEAEFRQFAQNVARGQFIKAGNLAVKQEALNLLGLVVTIEDLDMLMEHVVESPPEFYNTCRPLYAFSALKESGHAAVVRQALYDARANADSIVKVRIDELLEYIRYRH